MARISRQLWVHLAAFLVAAAATDAFEKFKKIVTWGNDLGCAVQFDRSRAEPSLMSLCSTPGLHAVFIMGIDEHFIGRSGYPKLRLAHHCTNTFKPSEDNDFCEELLNCPDVADDIAYCQKRNVLVFLTIANKASNCKLRGKDAKDAAQAIWNMFLGGKSSFRPFGPSVRLDGVNLMIRDSPDGYMEYAVQMRSLMNSDKSRRYYMAISPNASFPDGYCGPNVRNGALRRPELFDWVSLHALSSPDATFRLPNLLFTTLAKWDKWASALRQPNASKPKLFLAIPAAPKGVGAPGDYISIRRAINKRFFERIRKLKNFVGLHFLDFSLDEQNKVQKTETYSEMLMSFVNDPKKLKKAMESGKFDENDEEDVETGSQDREASSDNSKGGRGKNNKWKKKWGLDFRSEGVRMITWLDAKFCFYIAIIVTCLLF